MWFTCASQAQPAAQAQNDARCAAREVARAPAGGNAGPDRAFHLRLMRVWRDDKESPMRYLAWIAQLTRTLALMDAWYRHYEAQRDIADIDARH